MNMHFIKPENGKHVKQEILLRHKLGLSAKEGRIFTLKLEEGRIPDAEWMWINDDYQLGNYTDRFLKDVRSIENCLLPIEGWIIAGRHLVFGLIDANKLTEEEL